MELVRTVHMGAPFLFSACSLLRGWGGDLLDRHANANANANASRSELSELILIVDDSPPLTFNRADIVGRVRSKCPIVGHEPRLGKRRASLSSARPRTLCCCLEDARPTYSTCIGITILLSLSLLRSFALFFLSHLSPFLCISPPCIIKPQFIHHRSQRNARASFSSAGVLRRSSRLH